MDLHSSAVSSGLCKSAFSGMGCRGRVALPLHQQYRNQASWDFAYFSAATTLHLLCEWLRMKFSAGFLQWSRQRRPAVTNLIAKHAMF